MFILRRIRHILTSLVLCIAVQAFLHTPPAQALEKATIQLKWLHHFQFAGYYAALEKGFFRDAGLIVTIREGGPNIEVEDEVETGRADFGVGTSALLLHRGHGDDLVVLGQIFQHSPAIFLVPRKTGIRSVADMAGKRFMYSNQHGDMLALLKKNGIDEKDITKVPHQGDVLNLIQEKADVMIAYNFNEPFVMEQAGEPYLTFSPLTFGIDFYGDNFFTTRKLTDSRPDFVKAFRSATLRGWQYALTHKEEVADIILAKYSTKKNREWLLFEANQMESLIQPDLVELGYQSPIRWQNIAKTFTDLGMLPAGFDASAVIYAPEQPSNYRLIIVTIVASAAIIAFLGILTLTFRRLNKQLTVEISDRSQIEDALRESSSFNEQIINSAQEGIIVYDKDLRYVIWNPYMEQISGMKAADVIGRYPLDIFPFLKEGGVIERLEHVLAGHDVTATEFPFLVPGSGKEGYSSDLSAPLRNKSGDIIGVIGMVHDITERKLTDDALRFVAQQGWSTSGKDFFSALVLYLSQTFDIPHVLVGALSNNQNSIQTVAMTNNGTLTDNMTYSLCDTPCEKVINQTLCHYPHGVQQLFPKDTMLTDMHIESYLGMPLWDSTGKHIGLIALLDTRPISDINAIKAVLQIVATRAAAELERKESEIKLKNSEQFLMESQHVGRIGSFDCDLVQKTWICTQILNDLFGIDDTFSKDIDGWYSLIVPEQREQMEDYLEHIVLNAKQPFDKEYTIIRRSDGEKRWVHGYGRLHFGQDGSPTKMIGTIQDVTERRNMEEERLALEHQLLNNRKLESLGVLAGGIAHDFNNILTGVMGNISFARSFIDETHRASSILQNAENASQKASALAYRLLTFAKGEQPIKRVVSANKLISEAIALVLSGSKVKSEVSIANKLLPLEVDEGQIGQAFNNILINALQAMPNGGKISITAQNCVIGTETSLPLSPGNYVTFCFTDYGSGIPEEDQMRIFDPYFTTKEEGNGLGLASAYSIISKHGGHVGVRSLIGVGSTFEVILPASSEQLNEIEEISSNERPHVQLSTSILVMDDEPMIRNLAQQMLEELGYRVQTCADGDEAILLYNAARHSGNPYAAVIMDLTIPGGMGGKEAAQCILAYDNDACLIVSSGYSNDPVMAEYASYGFRARMPKPYSMKQIATVLESVTVIS